MFLPSGDEEAQPLFADTGDYMEFTDMQHAQQSLGRLLDGVSNTFDMPLVFFEDMTISVLGALRAMQCATPWEPGGVLLLGPVGSGRKTCAAAASALVSSSLQRPRSVDLAGLRNEIRQFSATDSLGRGLQSFGPITEDWLLLEGGDMVLEDDIDDIIRGATRIEVQKTVHALLRTKSRAESDQDDPPRRTLKGSETSKYQGAARLAFVLCFSPSLAPEWFRQQLARFSCLSSMGVVWLQPWRHNAFLEVGTAVLSYAGLDSASLDYDAKEQRIASMSSAAAEMMEMQRAGAQTPGGGAHFISAVTTVREMLSAKEAELNKESKSLDRVADALAQMAKHLEVFQAKHGNAWREVQDCEQMVKEMEKQLEQKLQDAEEAKAHGEILSQQEEEVKLQVSKCSIVVHDATEPM
ncbi:unnamed protein product [Effrenium voratum]|uniref:Uncharacterized protein n=1 Tax=Effrenium voratum TaxID=2562239 RepID=A0AA36JFR4_9DINO|nr:unnamed protein product [Effrenium voratum]